MLSIACFLRNAFNCTIFFSEKLDYWTSAWFLEGRIDMEWIINFAQEIFTS
jgi:hypothetical protein